MKEWVDRWTDCLMDDVKKERMNEQKTDRKKRLKGKQTKQNHTT